MDEAAIPAAPAVGLSVASAPAPRPTQSARRAAPARRAPVITVNYAYLRRDITRLAVLAPAMVVLVLIAYFTLH
jgi:hypothetical protein